MAREINPGHLVRIKKVLAELGLDSHEDILKQFDKRSDWSAIRGIGPKTGGTFNQIMQLPKDEWELIVGLPYYDRRTPW